MNGRDKGFNIFNEYAARCVLYICSLRNKRDDSSSWEDYKMC